MRFGRSILLLLILAVAAACQSMPQSNGGGTNTRTRYYSSPPQEEVQRNPQLKLPEIYEEKPQNPTNESQTKNDNGTRSYDSIGLDKPTHNTGSETPSTFGGRLRRFATELSTRFMQAGADLIRPLGLDMKKTAATISTVCHTGAMNMNASALFQRGVQYIRRHTSLEQLYRNIENMPSGMVNLILSEHGFPGGLGQLSAGNIAKLASVIQKHGFKRVILTSCSTGAGPQGKNFVQKLSDLSGAQVVAWDQILWMYGHPHMQTNQNSNVVIATPTGLKNNSTEPMPRHMGNSPQRQVAEIQGGYNPRQTTH